MYHAAKTAWGLLSWLPYKKEKQNNQKNLCHFLVKGGRGKSSKQLGGFIWKHNCVRSQLCRIWAGASLHRGLGAGAVWRKRKVHQPRTSYGPGQGCVLYKWPALIIILIPQTRKSGLRSVKSLGPGDASLKKGQGQTQVCQLQGPYLTSSLGLSQYSFFAAK